MLKGLRKRLAAVFTAFTGAVLAGVLAVTYYFTAQQTIRENELWFSNAIDSVASTVMTRNINGEPMSGVYVGGEYIVCVQKNGEADDETLETLPLLMEDTGSAGPAVTVEEVAFLFEEAKAVSEEEGMANWVEESYAVAVAEESAGGTAYSIDEGNTTVTVDGDYYYGEMQPVQPSSDPAQSYETLSIVMGPVVGTEGIFNLDSAGTSYRATYYTWNTWEPGSTDVVYEVAIMEDLGGQTRQLLLAGLLYLLLLLAGLAVLYFINWFLARLVLRPTEEGLRRQTEFVAAASHELRSPLAVIRSSLSAADATEDDEEAGRFKDAAAQEAERMSHLVDDLLLLAGEDAGGWNLSEGPVDMDTLLIDAAEVYRPLAKEKGVGLELELPEETLPAVNGDAERLRQILAVLMDNALQYAPSGTAITLSAKLKKGKLRISVADRGRGIPDGEKEKVFERFYRADESRHDKAHFGLGLSVARELAELHGGTLSATDTKDGGATFILKLPV